MNVHIYIIHIGGMQEHWYAVNTRGFDFRKADEGLLLHCRQIVRRERRSAGFLLWIGFISGLDGKEEATEIWLDVCGDLLTFREN